MAISQPSSAGPRGVTLGLLLLDQYGNELEGGSLEFYDDAGPLGSVTDSGSRPSIWLSDPRAEVGVLVEVDGQRVRMALSAASAASGPQVVKFALSAAGPKGPPTARCPDGNEG